MIDKEMEQKEYSVAICGCHEDNIVTVYLTEDELRAINKVNDELENASNVKNGL